MSENNILFEDIRPYDDSQIAGAMARVVEDPMFDTIRTNLFPDYSRSEFAALFLSLDSVNGFQIKVMHQAICRILEGSQSSYSIRGLHNIDPAERYVFISNHRDIVLDSAILQVGLVDNGFQTTEITFGSNLMQSQITIDIGKSNKMFKVVRATSTRDFLIQSQILSQYIRYAVTEKRESVWIAQRNGRTKNGDDRTEPGLLKMLCMSGHEKEIAQRIGQLNIVPIVVSYQWEPCDALKTKEIYLSRRQKYEKSAHEDLNSIVTGITQKKGEIVIEILRPLNALWDGSDHLSQNESMRQIAGIIDHEIHRAYHLFDTNYLAWDLLHRGERYLNVHYGEELRSEFSDRMNALLDQMEGDRDELTTIFLEIYACPVDNKLKTK